MNNNFNDFRLKLIFLALCILILLAIKGHIKLGYAPELERKSIAVAFDYYGAFEKEVEVLVSCLEEAFMEIRGIKGVSSVSEPGRGFILCQFSDKTSLDEAYVQISDISAHVWVNFPTGVNRPSITRSSRETYPVYIAYFPLEKAEDAERIKKVYEAVPGVGAVELGGRTKKELMVELHTDRLAGMALSSAGLDSGLRSSNLARKVAMPGGQTLVLSSRLSSPNDYGQVQIAPDLRLSDVADIKYIDVEAQGIGHIDGQSMLLFFIMKSGEGNIVRLCRQIDLVTSHFGGSQFFSLGCKIEKSFISSSIIFLLLFIFLGLGLWQKTRNFHLVVQLTCFSIISLLVAIFAVTMIGFQVDITVMAALFLILCFSFGSGSQKSHKYILNQYDEPINVQDIATLRSIGRKSINDFTSEDIDKSGKWAYRFWQQLGTKSPFFRRFFGDWRANDITPVNVVDISDFDKKDLDKYLNTEKRTISNLDTKNKDGNGWGIRISSDGIKNTKRHSGMGYLSAKALVEIDGLIKNAVFLDTEVHEIHKTSKKNDNVTFDHKFYALGKRSNGTALYKITVEEIYQDYLHPDDKRFHNLKYIEKIAGVTDSRTSDPSPFGGTVMASSPATKYTVADLHALVKKYDKDFHPMPLIRKISGTTLFITIFLVLSTLIIVLYSPVYFKKLVLPFCIALTSGLCTSAVCQCLMKKGLALQGWVSIPLWSYSPILLFVLLLLPLPFSPFASDISFSMEYESGTAFPFIQKSALDIESELLNWNAFDRLTLHIDRGRATFTVIGGKKRDIMAKISELSSKYPEIFFYIPEKHTRHAVDVTVYGNDVNIIENNILKLAKYVNENADNVNIIYNFKSDVTNIVLEIPIRCVSAGLYPYDVYKTLYYTASEPVVDKFFADGVETDVKIRGEERYRITLSGLLSVPVLSHSGIAGSAGDYINVRREQAQGRIYHKNRMRCLSFSVTGISKAELRTLVSAFPFSDSCHGEVGL